MKNKPVSSHRPAKKTNVSSRSAGSKSNVEYKKTNYSQQKNKSADLQSGFTEPSNDLRSGMGFDEATVGVP